MPLAIELRSADAQKQLLDDTVKAYTDNVQLTLRRFKGGVAPKADVAQAQDRAVHHPPLMLDLHQITAFAAPSIGTIAPVT